MQEINYNDFSEKWILLNTEVRMMHNYSLQTDWEKAGNCAEVCAVLCEELQKIYKELQDAKRNYNNS